jgi:beta-phosphoglucomutase-like phosphatase (HAD superfamily)
MWRIHSKLLRILVKLSIQDTNKIEAYRPFTSILVYRLNYLYHNTWRNFLNQFQDCEAVFFDLDGLLVDTEGIHVQAYEDVAAYLGIELTPEYVNAFIGSPTAENIKRIMRDNNVPYERYEHILKIRYNRYVELVKRIPLEPMDGAEECILQVKKMGYRTALVTSSIREHSVAVLDNITRHSTSKIEIADYFDTMVFGDDIKHQKPEPDIYREAVKRLNTTPEAAVALEDSEAGVTAAKRAGVRVIAVPCHNTREQDFSNADQIVDSLTALLAQNLFNIRYEA